MLDDYKSVSFLAGVSLLLLTSVSIGAFAYSSLRNDYAEKSTENPGEKTAKESLSGGVTTQGRSFSPPEATGGQGFDNSKAGIPIGKYSQPPTTIETGSYEMPKTAKQKPIDNFQSSVERNRAIGQTLNRDNYQPDYSSPSSSNNFHNSQENSLIKPLEENSLLESPQNNSTRPSLSPVTEPLGRGSL